MFKLLLVIFIPPLYLLIRGKAFQAFLNSMAYFMAWILVISFFGAIIAPIPWLIAVTHAFLAWNEERTQRHMKQHAEVVAAATRGE